MSARRRARGAVLAIAMPAALLAPLAGCYTGPGPTGFPPAVSPYGVSMELQAGRATYAGELLEARDTAFVILHSSGPTLVPFTAVRTARFARFTPYETRYLGGVPAAAQLAELRLLARYPQGLTAEQLARLVAAYGQRELHVVRP